MAKCQLCDGEGHVDAEVEVIVRIKGREKRTQQNGQHCVCPDCNGSGMAPEPPPEPPSAPKETKRAATLFG